MDKDQQDHKRFLEQQLERCKEHDRILEEIEVKLYEMKKLAGHVLEHELTSAEADGVNG
ncbi:hypothetical protein [Domibacillus aminovorans]|uniref:hypothetical protein n=1 Tax=Domibacillus aminovorans TaxID=29332 RepID=UPI001E4DF990|nr:hypothetical protein [Domibacillus aminovorans]